MTAPVSVLKSVDLPRSVVHKLQCTVVDGREGAAPGQVPRPLRLRVERRAEGYLLQLSHEKDLRFLYRDVVTPAKFQELAATWNLRNVDMEDFFQEHLAEFLKGDTSKCLISSTGETCKLEFERCYEIYAIHINLELEQIAGEELLQHIIDLVTTYAKRLKTTETEVTRLRTLEKESGRVKQKAAELESELAEAQAKVESLEAQVESVDRQRLDAENNCQLAADERDDVERELDDAKRDLEQAMDDYDELKSKFDQLHYDKQDLNTANAKLKEKIEHYKGVVKDQEEQLAKYDHIMQKYGPLARPPVSVSDAKLAELEAASREKDSIIESLQKKMSELVKKNGELEEGKKKVDAALLKAVAMNKDLEVRAKSVEGHNIILQSVFKKPVGNQRIPPQVGLPTPPLHALNGVNNISPQPNSLSRMNMLYQSPPHALNQPANRFANPEPYRYQPSGIPSGHSSPSTGGTVPFQPTTPSSVNVPQTGLSPLLQQILRERENIPPRQ